MIIDKNKQEIETIYVGIEENLFPKIQERIAPIKGRNIIKLYISSFQNINIFNINGAFVSKINY